MSVVVVLLNWTWMATRSTGVFYSQATRLSRYWRSGRTSWL